MTNTMMYKPITTVVDVLESGACREGVAAWLLKNGRIIAVDSSKHESNSYIMKACDGNGNGNGYGDGGLAS